MLYKFEDGLFVIYNCKHNYNWTNKNNIEELDVYGYSIVFRVCFMLKQTICNNIK